jgi:hypothetical protein
MRYDDAFVFSQSSPSIAATHSTGRAHHTATRFLS